MATEKVCDLFQYLKEKLDTKRIIKLEEKNELRDYQLGSQIAYYRKKCHLTQEELANKLNVSRDLIIRYETNKIGQKLINKDFLLKIFEYLDMTNKVMLNDYMGFILNDSTKALNKFLNENNIKRNELAKLMNVNKCMIEKWVKGTSIMSKKSFNKLKPILDRNNFNIRTTI